MTEKQITIKLWWNLRSASDLLLPRYTPPKWWECDLWRLTKNGYVDEYEIKTNPADYKADFKKSSLGRLEFNEDTKRWTQGPATKKHDLLKDGKGPNRFWFVLPESMEATVVPEYAGLIIFTERGVRTIKAAPKIHKVKWEGNRARILEAFYHRYWAHEVSSKGAAIEPLPAPLASQP